MSVGVMWARDMRAPGFVRGPAGSEGDGVVVGGRDIHVRILGVAVGLGGG
jgi:hypothetical protein